MCDHPLIFTLALTGGPCGGKSSSLAAFTTALQAKGYNVYACPEVPSIMIQGGCAYPGEAAGQRLIEFETALIQLQLQMENSFQQVARSTHKPSVIVVDRGLIDISAYLPAEQWQQVLSANSLNEAHLASRYSMVLHLVTAADGAAAHYTTANNAARTETAAEAVALDRRFHAAWGRHPALARAVVDNSTDFAGKVRRSVDAVLACVEKAAAAADAASDAFAAESTAAPPLN